MKAIVILSVLVLGFAPVAAVAQDFDDEFDDSIFRGWGPRLGMTMDPDQIHFGFHLDFGRPYQHLRFQPNVELGMGDDMTLLAINAEGAYRFSSSWNSWGPYLGAGVGLNIWGSDGVQDPGTELGVNALGGLEKGMANGSRLFIEGKAGLADSPDFKVTAGWTFAH